MMINWKVRFVNQQFWVSFIPAVLLVVEAAAKQVGYELDLGELGNNILGVVRALFVVLALLGVVTDPTTEGVGDSQRALMYVTPSK